MGKELKKKASLIFGPRPAIPPLAKDEETGRPKTAIGAMAQFTNRQSEAVREAEDLRRQVKEFEGALPVRKLSSKLIVRSQWANRHADSFTDSAFANLKQEISDAGGNVQPIKVRAIKDDSGRYEIVFGQRRHQACLELGLDVLAMVDDLDEKQLFIEMERENRQRKDLRPYEIGAMYNQALEAGLFSSARQLAEAIAVDQSQLTKALNLAKLPADVLKAFSSPLDLQYRWASDLMAALQRDPDYVLSIARELQALSPRLGSAEVFKRLTVDRGTVPHLGVETVTMTGKGEQTGVLTLNSAKGSASIKLSHIPPARLSKLQALIQDFLSK